MNKRYLHVREEMVWYTTWSVMLTIAVANTLLPYPIFSGSLGFIFSMTMAAIASVQLMTRARFLEKRVRLLAMVLLVLFGVAQVVFWIGGMGSEPPRRRFDFSAYYVAAKLISEKPIQSPYLGTIHDDGRIVLSNSGNIYPRWNDPAYRYQVPFAVPFIYPPLTAILMKRLALLSFSSAYFLWNLLTVMAACGAVVLSLNLGGRRIEPKLLLILGVGLFSYYPFQWDLILGQVGCFILFFIVASVWLLRRSGFGLSALSFAMATMIKLTPVLAIPILIFHRRWLWLVAYAGWLVAILAFSVWQVGWFVQYQFFYKVLPSLSCGSPVCLNTSIPAFVQQLFLGYVPPWYEAVSAMPKYACGVSRAVAAGVYGLMLMRFWRRRKDGDLVRDLVLMSLLGISVSPISWWHHYTLAVLPLLYLWCHMSERGSVMLAALVLVTGTNIVGFAQLLTTTPIAQLTLSAIVPLLTIGFVYVHLERKSTYVSKEEGGPEAAFMIS
jgi:hypothetical protein